MTPPTGAATWSPGGGPRVAVVGAGIVGARAARELIGPGPDGGPLVAAVSIVTRRTDRAAQLRSTFAEAVSVRRVEPHDPGVGDADVVVVAREAGHQLPVVSESIASGRHVVATTDDPDEVEAILALAPDAVAAGVAVVVGVAMSPGLSCLLARHAGGVLDVVDEIHVARDGAAGPACARRRLKALRGGATEWRDGAWVRRAGFSGRELCWFPDPIGARDCYRGELAEPQVLVDAFPDVLRVSARLAASPLDRLLAPLPVWVGPPVEGGPGAVRVEVRGMRAGRREVVVYGVLDRPGVAGAATAAVVALWVGAGRVRPGVHGAGAIEDPLPILRELARRGVRAAAFDGAGSRHVPDVADDLAERVQVPPISGR
jgi:hypothetical protein